MFILSALAKIYSIVFSSMIFVDQGLVHLKDRIRKYILGLCGGDKSDVPIQLALRRSSQRL